jgi:hypothetical protein
VASARPAEPAVSGLFPAVTGDLRRAMEAALAPIRDPGVSYVDQSITGPPKRR